MSLLSERKAFGSTGLSVSPIGVGCARIGGVFQNDPAGFTKLLHGAVDLGVNFFDTADMYSQGESETILGRALKGRRDRVVIASKVGYVLPAQRRLAGRIKPLLRPLIRALGIKRAHLPAAVRGAPSQNFTPTYIARALESSLRRLRTDRIDVLQLHSPPLSVIRRGDWSDVLDRLRREGKILHYGIACDTAEDAVAALELPGVAVVQVTVNLIERSAATAIASARERGIAVIARECLANGLLAKEAGGAETADPARARAIEAYRAIAREHELELPALALHYAMTVPGVSVALVGLRTPVHLDGVVRWLGSPKVATALARVRTLAIDAKH